MKQINAQQVADFLSTRSRVKLPGCTTGAQLNAHGRKVLSDLQAIDSAEGILAALKGGM